MRKLTLLLGLCACFSLSAQEISLQKQHQAACALIQRVLPEHYASFLVEITPKDSLQNDWFEIEQAGEKILLRGTSGVSVASALHYYLEHYTHKNLPPATYNLPPVHELVHKQTPYRYRYYLNYCTFNYSMSWWDWPRWQREIDYMAMRGINLPLALTGQNSIWQRVYRKMGFSDEDLASFFPGPAYFNWFWMGNLDGWGGPLPQAFMEGQEQLQKQILERERSLGMTPILPAFTGHVPSTFKEKFPNAKLKVTHWLDFPETCILDPEDPLFEQIGVAFLQEMIRTYGTSHFYSSDTFNENTPPQNDSAYLDAISRQVFGAMLKADPKAIWVMQGWLFTQARDFWGETETKALLNAVPDDRMLILDLWTEVHPVWQRKEAFYGKPWIWCMLNNFGGNNLMYARMDEVAAGPVRTRHDSRSGNIQGIGLTPEAIENNPVIYEMMLSHVWQSDSIAVLPWLHQYALCRYGLTNDTIDAAWQILYRTVYSGGRGHGGPAASIIAGRPTLLKDSRWTETTKTYRHEDLWPAWSLLLSQSAKLADCDGYKYDLVDLTRQVLANYADSLQRKLADAYLQEDYLTYRTTANQFLQVISDMDTLLLTRPEWRLSTWVESAKEWGTTPEQKALYERNARNLITTWGPKDCTLHDYAWRLWSGMLQDFYYPRWKQYFDYLDQCIANHTAYDQSYFDEQIREWEWQWVTTPHPSPLTSHPSPLTSHPSPYTEIEICEKLYTIYL